MAEDGRGRGLIGPGQVDLGQLRHVFGGLGATLTAMTGGSSPVFRVDLADGTVLVLRTYDELHGTGPAKEDYAARLLDDLGLPTTRFLVVDDTRTKLPFPFAITTYLPGVTAASLADVPDISDIHVQMGALLRRLHGVRLPAYGQFDGNGIVDAVGSNPEFVRRTAADAFARFRHYGADQVLAQQLEQIAAARLDAASYSAGPVFAHNDFHPHNVLVTRDASARLQLSGLIDFGNACAADAVSDLAKALFYCDRDAPGSRPSIMAGYGAVDHPDPDAALWLYTLLHRIELWCWLRRAGTAIAVADDSLYLDLQQIAADDGVA